jgi:hypothetical protein
MGIVGSKFNCASESCKAVLNSTLAAVEIHPDKGALLWFDDPRYTKVIVSFFGGDFEYIAKFKEVMLTAKKFLAT